MGVRVVFPDMGKDPSIQLIEKTITENGTYDAITDGANGYSKVKVNVGGGGGGGESDFSTAEVTISTNSGSIGVYLPNADEEVGAVSGVLANTTPKVFTAILYKGHANVTVGGEDFRITSVGGNATLTDGVVDVTGDCTIGITHAGH